METCQTPSNSAEFANTKTTALSKPKNRSSKRLITLGLSCALALSLALGGALAYLTDSASVINDLSLNTNLSITLNEPSWDADDAKAMVPTKTVAKDPVITNSGAMDAWVFAKVKVPVFTGSVANEEGIAQAVTDGDLFTYETNEGWTLENTSPVESGFRTYTYIYEDALAPGQSSRALFDEVTMANLTQGLAITDTQIVVDGFAMQKVGFESASDAMAGYNAQAGATASNTEA